MTAEGYLIGAVSVLSAAVAFLWKWYDMKLEKKDAIILDLTKQILEAMNNNNSALRDIKEAFVTNTKTIKDITTSDLWQLLMAKKFLDEQSEQLKKRGGRL